MKPKDRPLNEEEGAEMKQGIAAGLQRVNLSTSSPPDLVQQAIKPVIDQLRTQFANQSEDDGGDAIWALASLWGDAVTRATDWEWILLLDGDEEIHAIAPPARSHVIYPFHYIHSLLSDPDADQTSLLLYNMLKAGNLPPAKPGDYYAIG